MQKSTSLTHGPIALLFILAIPGTAVAAVSEKASEAFAVKHGVADIFDGNDFINDWAISGGSLDAEIDGPQLTLTVTDNNGWINLDTESSAWETGVENGGSWTLEVRMRLAEDEGNGIVIWAANGSERGILQVNTNSTEFFGGQVYNTEANTDGFHDFRMAFDADAALYFFWRDGELLNPDGSASQAPTGNNRLIIGDCCSNIPTTSFDVEHVRFDTSGAFSPVVDSSDTDGDGIPDFYEDENGLDPAVNDAAEDKDGDGLTNLAEFEAGLPANDPDADDDGLSDGVETGTGTWVSGNDTGTQPKSKDSDGDGLDDGVETNTGIFVDAANSGTDPNKKDSDGDTFEDGTEVARGADPTDIASVPPPSIQPKNSSAFEFIADANEIFDGTDLLGDWVNAGGVTDFELDGSTLTLISADNNGWLEHDNGATPWENGVEGGGSWTAEIRVRLANDDANGIVIWGANGSERGIMQIDTAAVTILGADFLDENDNTDEFHTFRMAFDADEGLYFYWRDGIALIEEGLPAQAATANNRFIVGDCCSTLPMTSVDLEYIRYDTTGAWSPGSGEPPVITDLTIDRQNNVGSITWRSANGEVYSVESSKDLQTWLEVEDSIAPQGDTTSQELEFSAEDSTLYFRVSSQ